jgi:hypothetical protein
VLIVLKIFKIRKEIRKNSEKISKIIKKNFPNFWDFLENIFEFLSIFVGILGDDNCLKNIKNSKKIRKIRKNFLNI